MLKVQEHNEVLFAELMSAWNCSRIEAVVACEFDCETLEETRQAMAKELKIPVLCLVQMNRAILSRTQKKPTLADLRESGAIEQDADCVLFIDRPSYYEEEKPDNEASVIIAKNRQGRTDSIPLLWFGPTQTFAQDWTRDADKADQGQEGTHDQRGTADIPIHGAGH